MAAPGGGKFMLPPGQWEHGTLALAGRQSRDAEDSAVASLSLLGRIVGLSCASNAHHRVEDGAMRKKLFYLILFQKKDEC